MNRIYYRIFIYFLKLYRDEIPMIEKSQIGMKWNEVEICEANIYHGY